LSHSPALFAFCYFLDRILCFCMGPASDLNPPACASHCTISSPVSILDLPWFMLLDWSDVIVTFTFHDSWCFLSSFWILWCCSLFVMEIVVCSVCWPNYCLWICDCTFQAFWIKCLASA
jgi:hypothetical protein